MRSETVQLFVISKDKKLDKLTTMYDLSCCHHRVKLLVNMLNVANVMRNFNQMNVFFSCLRGTRDQMAFGFTTFNGRRRESN